MTDPRSSHMKVDGEYFAIFTYGENRIAVFFYADDWPDALARVRAIRTTAVLEGGPTIRYRTNALTLPLVAAWVRIECWLRNFFGVGWP